MLTIIGLMPASYALNPRAHDQLTALSRNAEAAIPLLQKYGDDRKDQALQAADVLKNSGSSTAEQFITRVADTTPEARVTPAGFTGLPVSTTHIITSGIAGTMIAGGQPYNDRGLSRS
jgi:hypothetical protein